MNISDIGSKNCECEVISFPKRSWMA